MNDNILFSKVALHSFGYWCNECYALAQNLEKLKHLDTCSLFEEYIDYDRVRKTEKAVDDSWERLKYE